MQFFARFSGAKNKSPAPTRVEAGLEGTLVTSPLYQCSAMYNKLNIIYLYKSINPLSNFLNEMRVISVKKATIHTAAYTFSFTIYPNGVDCKGSHLFRFRKRYELFYDCSYRCALLLGLLVQPLLRCWRYAPCDNYRSAFDGCLPA